MKTTSSLKWVKVSRWFAQTECGRYRCRKFIPGEDVLNDPQEPMYQLQRRVAPGCYVAVGLLSHDPREIHQMALADMERS